MAEEEFLHLQELSVKKTFTATLPTTQAQTPARFILKSEFKTGAWANAVSATLDYGTTGSAHGMASAVSAELIPPNGSLERGALYALSVEIGCQASSTWGSAGPVGFIKFDQWGTKPHFDANAFLFDIQGLGEGTANMFSAGTADQVVKGTLKIRIGTTTYYIMLTDTATS